MSFPMLLPAGQAWRKAEKLKTDTATNMLIFRVAQVWMDFTGSDARYSTEIYDSNGTTHGCGRYGNFVNFLVEASTLLGFVGRDAAIVEKYVKLYRKDRSLFQIPWSTQ